MNEIAPLVLLRGPAVFVVSTLLARSARGAVGTAIVGLAPGSTTAQLRDALALAIGDPTLQLAFRLPEEQGYGDTRGRRLDLDHLAPGRAVTPLTETAMARDRAALADPVLGALIESAGKEAREAIVELRELARGIHPAVLTQTGLAGAVQALAERSPVPTTITEDPQQRFPAAIEATAYFVVSEALAAPTRRSPAGCTCRSRQSRRTSGTYSPSCAWSPPPRTTVGYSPS